MQVVEVTKSHVAVDLELTFRYETDPFQPQEKTEYFINDYLVELGLAMTLEQWIKAESLLKKTPGEVFQWIRPKLPDSEFKGKVIYLDWNCTLHVTPEQMMGARYHVYTDLQAHMIYTHEISGQSVGVEQWRPGQAVLAMYPPDKQWYRAEVLGPGVKCDQSVKIRY